MKTITLLLLTGAVVAAIFAFGGRFNDYPVYYDSVTVAPYQFASFLFWLFMILFLAALAIGAANSRKNTINSGSASASKLEEQEAPITGGFALALLFVVAAVISGLFGFGAVSSTLAGLAMIIFWLAVVLGVVAVISSLYDYRHLKRR